MEGARHLIARLRNEGRLRRSLDPSDAADLLWSITSLHTWEDLVVVRGWSAKQYQRHVSELLMSLLVEPA